MAIEQRNIISRNLAVEIYSYKIRFAAYSKCSVTSSSLRKARTRVSKLFDVIPKTVKDIWNRKSWVQATSHLWVLETEYIRIEVCTYCCILSLHLLISLQSGEVYTASLRSAESNDPLTGSARHQEL